MSPPTLIALPFALSVPAPVMPPVTDRLRLEPVVLSVPDVIVALPASVRLPFIVRPFELFSVRLLRFETLLGTKWPLELPPIERFEEEVVVRLPELCEIAGPFSVSVFEPTASAPLVSVSVPES